MSRKHIAYLAILLSLGILTVRLFLPEPQKDEKEVVPFFVKVRIMKPSESFLIFSKDPVNVSDISKKDLLAQALLIPAGSVVSIEDGKINIAGKSFLRDKIVVSPMDDESIGIGKELYSGEIIILNNKTGLSVINRVEIEDYLRGVLPKEVYPVWPYSMLKAQAIVSRSFAIFETLRNSNKEYGLTSDTFSQVYAGRSSENHRTNKAVKETVGMVLAYDKTVLPAFFHSCCGGHTRNPENIWSIVLAPLKGVRCGWCRWSPHYKWKTRIGNEDIESRFKKAGYSFEGIDDIRTGKTDENGFLIFVRVKSGGKWYDVSIRDFRAVLGRSYMKSSKFKIKKYPRFFDFKGYGWGHGVGMCQWGAFGASLRRWNEEKILKHYYPGARITAFSDLLDPEKRSNFDSEDGI